MAPRTRKEKSTKMTETNSNQNGVEEELLMDVGDMNDEITENQNLDCENELLREENETEMPTEDPVNLKFMFDLFKKMMTSGVSQEELLDRAYVTPEIWKN